ncbi:putative methylesterase 14 [Forsythia ovata]|uniref:Methylesterase 14 n=1 Tax=Forsythia ovata TaxID=205694 RepID=A0ABD1S4F3_9LAMI
MTKKESKNVGIGSKSKRGSMSRRRSSMEEELLYLQALAMAIQQHQLSQRFDNNNGSMSWRIGSTSSRHHATNLSDPFSNTNTKHSCNNLTGPSTKDKPTSEATIAVQHIVEVITFFLSFGTNKSLFGSKWEPRLSKRRDEESKLDILKAEVNPNLDLGMAIQPECFDPAEIQLIRKLSRDGTGTRTGAKVRDGTGPWNKGSRPSSIK